MRMIAPDPLKFLVNMVRDYGDVVNLSPGRIYLFAHPDHVKHILQDNHVNYLKGPRYKVLEPLMGVSLLNADGEEWRRQRRLAQPAFQRKDHAQLAGVITRATERMIERWQGPAARGEALSIREECIHLTLDILLEWMFSTGLSPENAKRVGNALLVVERSMDLLRSFNLFKVPDWVPTAAHREFREAVRTVDEFIFRLVDERRRTGERTGDLLSMLLDATDDEGTGGLTNKQLRDQLVTMVQAGHDTVSDLIAWTWYLLSRHPLEARRLQEEVDRELQGRCPALEDLPRLSYTLMVIQESMRLYPPAWVLARTPLADDQIGGYDIPANSLVVISPFVTHRLPALWSNPEGFDPERFSPEASAGRPRFAYFPFGAGPRQCIGSGVSIIEAQLIIARVAQTYRLDLVPGMNIRPRPRISLTPDQPVWMVPQRHAERIVPAGGVA